MIVAIDVSTKPHTFPSPRRKAGLFIAAVNTPSSHPPAMTLDTQMTLALLQELLLALDGYVLFFYILYKVAEFSQ
ncbi:hypothetical protein N8654_00485 [Synechococcus sp. AH-601-B19]|nr:hypothetical protein [Synechococcus sp. AH-601-B19]